MSLLTAYALGRLAFGAGVLAAPEPAGRLLAGTGGAAPDAQAFLRGMGGREVGLGCGLLAAARAGSSPLPWLAAGVCADAGDIAGITGAWKDMAPDKRVPGVAFAGLAAAAGLLLMARPPA